MTAHGDRLTGQPARSVGYQKWRNCSTARKWHDSVISPWSEPPPDTRLPGFPPASRRHERFAPGLQRAGFASADPNQITRATGTGREYEAQKRNKMDCNDTEGSIFVIERGLPPGFVPPLHQLKLCGGMFYGCYWHERTCIP